MIFLDFETNSHNVHDVIEVAALRVSKTAAGYIVTETFHRYYLSRYPVNPHSLAVHKLSPSRLIALRGEASYPEHFDEDREFADFCNGATTLVAHNIAFELRHLGDLVAFEKHFCTMQANKRIVNAKNVRGGLKNPKLAETCAFYGIDFDEEQYHSAIYDVTKTLEILNRMDGAPR
ncbi:exonuclease domain-containing protein [Sulfurimonas sp. ST-25]|uniref:3'-5' exonuclease n=1 Tax=Sulfurimonas sp. ST-25 TaxID=3400151 RepID=UPI003A85BFA9